MHELELIRAAAQDVAAARSLLRQRLDTLAAINRDALARGIPAVDVAVAGGFSPTGIRNPVGDARR
ncbi:hypothetical protein BLJ79_13515 [Arthrobacter sp. UCD-GKA]|uniref:hypothetical protein n=1 Tax=Arthrobacter sp. UCD-GKA TaxID=1913576 RepID=UPI0008DCBACC|nr:hypothetical protein [Arthrobacter sp. UCD-GKA]OIH83722.1 hypothetical protein BLJ79_13515 [Arthrobacter sp. UCD-GKA]